MTRAPKDRRRRYCPWCEAGFPALEPLCPCGETLHLHEEELLPDQHNFARCGACARLLPIERSGFDSQR